MLLAHTGGNWWGPQVRKNRTDESNQASQADAALRWQTVLRDILVPHSADAQPGGIASVDFDALRALLATSATADPASAPDASVPNSDGLLPDIRVLLPLPETGDEIEAGAGATLGDALAAGDHGPAAIDDEFSATMFASLLQRSTPFTVELFTERELGLGLPQPAVTESGADAAMGSLSIATLGADLGQLVGNGLANFGDSMLVGANGGDLAGAAFLIIDANGQAGFQAGEDEVLVVFRGLPSTDLSVDIPLI